jgi:hypothetical protein
MVDKMSSKKTWKKVQMHAECICGFNRIYTETLPIKWKNLSSFGIKRKKDKKTGKTFLFKYQFFNKCDGHSEA